MAYSFYPGKPSFLAQKYLRTYIPSTTLQPGERYALRRTMEAKVTVLYWNFKAYYISMNFLM